MTDVLNTQLCLEPVSEVIEPVCATQLSLEPIGAVAPELCATQLSLEPIGAVAPELCATQLSLEPIGAVVTAYEVTQLVLEVLTPEASLDAPFIDSTTVLYPPRVGPWLEMPFINSTGELWVPTRGPFLQVPFIAESNTLFTPIRGPSLAIPFLDSTNILWSPNRIHPVYVDWMPQLQTQANPLVAPSLIQNALRPVLPVWPLTAPYGTPVPFATYTITGSEPNLFVSGYSGLSRTDVTIHVTHKRHRDALATLHNVIDALAATDGLRIGHHTIMEAMWDPETRLYTIPAEMSVWHS